MLRHVGFNTLRVTANSEHASATLAQRSQQRSNVFHFHMLHDMTNVSPCKWPIVICKHA